MSWIIGIIVVLVLLYFIGSMGGSSKTSKSKASDYIPSLKQEDGTWCTKEQAYEYLKLICSHHRKDYESVKEEFDKDHKRLLQFYKKEKKDNDKELESSIKFDNETMERLRNDQNSSEEDIAEVEREHEKEVKRVTKDHAKMDKWYANQLDKLETDCRQLLKHHINQILKPDSYSVDIRELMKEPPDSYYWQ